MRSINHVDMDEFFAAVEKLDNPDLRNKPILVGGEANSRGVVATASYEARAFGCHSAMGMAKAVRLCPKAIVIQPRFDRYQEISAKIFDILRQFTPLVEPLSIDEAFMDVTGSARLHGTGRDIAEKIKSRIRSEIGLTASVGVSFNKFLAKLASDLRKPDGLMVIMPDQVHEVLDPLPITKIWGVGPATAKQFQRLNIRTIGQLRSSDPELLERTFGKVAAEHFVELANGRDERPVSTESRTKSIGQEETFAVNTSELGLLRNVLLGQVQDVANKLRQENLRAKTVSLKLRYKDFTTVSRSATLPSASSSTETLWQAASDLLETWAQKTLQPLRLLGVSLSNLEPLSGEQLPLFTDDAQLKHRRLDQTVDEIVTRFGAGILKRGLDK